MSETPVLVTPTRRVALAYQAVFGRDDGSRSVDQKIVWQDMESFCHAHRLSCETDNLNSIDRARTYLNEGRRSFWLRARGQLILAATPPKPPTQSNRKKSPAKP